jgi:hypothetical protein
VRRDVFVDDFDGAALDPTVWQPHYLPVWSSRAATRAVHEVGGSCLRLSIPVDQGLWCPETHPTPLRVSGIQSGGHSGPVGSTVGQQRFRDGLVVREAQPRFEGWLPSAGRVEIRCRMELSHRSMAAMWLSGWEEDPDDSGELCIVEVFGRSVASGTAEVGVGVKRLHDPRLEHSFVAPALPLDVAEMHTYAVEWDATVARFTVDGQPVHTAFRPPTYPMQAMVAVFDFPDWSTGDDAHLVPVLEVDRVTGRA